MWQYRTVRVDRVIDGDTYDLVIDLGFYQFGLYRLRLLGWDAPEIYGRYASEGGQPAKEFVEDWFTEHAPDDPAHTVVVTTRKADSFGRWLAKITCADCAADLGEDMHAAGHVTRYTGHPVIEDD